MNKRAADNRAFVRDLLLDRYPRYVAILETIISDPGPWFPGKPWELTWSIPRVPSILPLSPELR